MQQADKSHITPRHLAKIHAWQASPAGKVTCSVAALTHAVLEVRELACTSALPLVAAERTALQLAAAVLQTVLDEIPDPGQRGVS